MTVGVCSDTVRAAIEGTSELGGDVGSVARNAVEQSIGSAKSIGLRAEDAASAAANRAVSAAGSFGQATTTAATESVGGVVGGVSVVLRAPFRGEQQKDEEKRDGA